MGLGIMGCSDGIDSQLFLEYPCVFLLKRIRHGISHVRKALMTVKSPYKIFFTVEIKTVRAPVCCSEACYDNFFVIYFSAVLIQYPDSNVIKIRRFRIPGFYFFGTFGKRYGIQIGSKDKTSKFCPHAFFTVRFYVLLRNKSTVFRIHEGTCL